METCITKLKSEQEAFFDQSKEKFKSDVKQIFSEIPNLIGFWFNQYTPNFNDGEPCKNTIECVYFQFDTHTIPVEIQMDENYEYLHEDRIKYPGIQSNRIKDEKLLSSENRKYLCLFTKELLSLDDFLEKIFGTDSSVLILKNGDIVVSDYDCGY